MRMTIIVPVHNNSGELEECLRALLASAGPDSEIIVVDDASTDDSVAVAMGMGIRVLRLTRNSGPAAARNLGVRHARGEILLFVDADVVVAPDAIARVQRNFVERPGLVAVFGSYDAEPRAEGVVSQYRNLLHHYVHQNGRAEASTFWAGCGAVRRAVFERIGGFDENRFARALEDVELGYRLRQAEHPVLLDKALLATHLKRWTLRSVIKTDVACRAIPWSRLILESGIAPDDLNLKIGQRWSVALVGIACGLLPAAAFQVELLAVSVGALLGVLVVNRRLFSFFKRRRGLQFALLCVPIHLLYYLYGGASYVYVSADYQLRNVLSRKHKTVQPKASPIA